MNTEIAEYIRQNRTCGENIFLDWKEFLNVLYKNGGRVDMIVWFDYCKLSEQEKSLGSGGYRDTRNPGFMWAETQIYEVGLANRSIEEISEYIERVRNEYPEHELYPSFYPEEQICSNHNKCSAGG